MATDRASDSAPAENVSGEQGGTSNDHPAASGDEPCASVDQPVASASAPAAASEDAADRLSGESSRAAEQEPSLQSLVQSDPVYASTDGAAEGAEGGTMAVQVEGSFEASGHAVVQKDGLGTEVGAEDKAEMAEGAIDVAPAAGSSAADLVEEPVAAEGSSGEQTTTGPAVQEKAGPEAEVKAGGGAVVGAECLAVTEPVEVPAAEAAEAAEAEAQEAEAEPVEVPAAAQGAEERKPVALEQGSEEPADPVVAHEASAHHEAAEQVAEAEQGDGEVVMEQEAEGGAVGSVEGGGQAPAQDDNMTPGGGKDGAQAVSGSQSGAGPNEAEPEAGLQQDVVLQHLDEQLGLGLGSSGQLEVSGQEEIGEGVWEDGAEGEGVVGPVVDADGEQPVGMGVVELVDEARIGKATVAVVQGDDGEQVAQALEEPVGDGENNVVAASLHGDA